MKPKKNRDMDDWPVAGGLFMGIGTGFITGQLVGFTLIGLGAGLLLTVLIKKWKKK